MKNNLESSFYRRWIWANGWAELLGLGGTMLLGWLGTRILSGDKLSPMAILGSALAAVVFGSLLEGALIGFAQARVLRERLVSMSFVSWILCTTLGAAIAWTLGMIPSTIFNLAGDQPRGAPPDIHGWRLHLLASAMGLVLGAILGVAQWRVLRRHVPRASRWIGANALAWTVGMPLVFLGMGTLSEDAGWLRLAVTVLVTCLVAGLAVGAIHGWVLVRLLRRDGVSAPGAA